MVKNFITFAAFAAGTNALVGRSDSCCFHLTSSGGASGEVGQLSDGQNRIGDNSLSPAQFCINSSGAITDSNGRGCILTAPTTQLQCDDGASPTTGFSINSQGQLEYSSNTSFVACATGQNGGLNIYTSPSPSDVTGCVDVKLTADTCSNSGAGSGGSSSSASAAPSSAGPSGAQSSPSAPASQSTPAGSAPASGSTPASGGAGSQPTGSAPGASAAPSGPGGGAGSGSGSSAPAASAPSESPLSGSPVTVVNTVTVTDCSCTASAPAAGGGSGQQSSGSIPAPSGGGGSQPSGSASAPSGSQPSESATAPAPSGSAGGSQPSGSASAYVPGSSASSTPTTGTSTTACPASLTSGSYETPHLIIPVDSSSPDTAAGTSYNGTVTSTISTAFNFDIPSSDAGKTCSLVFLFPELQDLETSSFTFSGDGKIDFAQLSSAVTESTTFNNLPSVSQDFGDMTVSPGGASIVATFACPAGQSVAFEMKNSGTTNLNFFEDWNPSPIGLFITTC